MSIFTGYVGARSCTGGPQPGAIALRDWAKDVYHARNDGIYNCRPVRGSTTTTSLHGEGRAVDIGCNAGDPWAATLADILRLHSKELGIQCIIYNRRIWSGAYPNAGWRPYGGVDSHTTHLHVELSWAAATGPSALTVEKIKAVLDGAKSSPVAAPTALAKTSPERTAALQTLMRFSTAERDGKWGPRTDQRALMLRVAATHRSLAGSKPSSVRLLQRIVGTPADGLWGDASRAAMAGWVKRLQRVMGVTADGIWGPETDAAFWLFRWANRGKY